MTRGLGVLVLLVSIKAQQGSIEDRKGRAAWTGTALRRILFLPASDSETY